MVPFKPLSDLEYMNSGSTSVSKYNRILTTSLKVLIYMLLLYYSSGLNLLSPDTEVGLIFAMKTFSDSCGILVD